MAAAGIATGLTCGVASASTLPAAPAPTASGVSFPIGTSVAAISVSPDGRQAYLVSATTNSVRILDLQTRTIVASVPVGREPDNVSFDASGTFAYVCNLGDDTVSVIDTATQQVVRTLPVAPEAGVGELAVQTTPTGDMLYIDGTKSGRLYQVDTSTGVVESVAVTSEPTTALLVGDDVVVADFSSDAVDVVDTATMTVTKTAHRPDQGWTINGAVLPGATTVTLGGPAGTAWFDAATGTFLGGAAGTAPGNPMGTATGTDGADTYALYGSFPDGKPQPGVIQVLNNTTHTDVTTIPVPQQSWHLAAAPGEILITHGNPNANNDTLQFIPEP
ncbi:beta-propeller fold lactonase family protein [Nakamurella alba]|uniref:beta-propeller fold lactonase family protein n=1 Tax=Nakamurella alba TaxID=2665158 RepID=UPI0018A9CF08|nr:beta-propeller fold lactonase family protein [Nakamurella alba]